MAEQTSIGRRRPAIAVVGAGIAGLSAALELSGRGCEVTLLERAAAPGGKLRLQGTAAHPIDVGPTVLTLQQVFAELFRDAGAELAEHLQLQPLEVLARHAWSQGERLDLHADIERSADAISEFAGAAEARGYRRLCADSRRIYRALDRNFMRASQPSLRQLIARAGLRGLPDLLRLKPFTSLWQALGGYFRDPRLRQLFGRYATYCGSSPFEAPATLMLVAHVEQAGVWQIAGGMYSLVTALGALLQRRGAQIRCNSHVRQLHQSRGRLQALELADGTRIAADAVILSCDAAALGAGCFGADVSAATPPVAPEQRSLSAITWSALARARGFELRHHNVFFSDDYAREFRTLRALQLPSHRPTVYLCAQDREASTPPAQHAPERLFCLINAPAIGAEHRYRAEEIDQCLTLTLETLRHCGLQLDLSPTQLRATTPNDFAQLFPGSSGALYGRATHGWRSSFTRPGPRTRIPGIYLAGGSTHPGPGLPMATLSGRNAARCLSQDLGLTRH